ncbi:MAG TPA: GNAT family N-acetyltransferase [Gemmatimonadaceae bacterium]|nr:GNAT family N-acetyltransferase [Gemmatimonadaceae bacterium]
MSRQYPSGWDTVERRDAAGFSIRRHVDSDRAAMYAFIAHDAAGTPYVEVPTYFLRLALEGRTDESRGIVAERGGEMLGFALYGDVAGAVGTGRIHFIGVTASSRLNAVGVSLCDAAVTDLATTGARTVIAELPDDPLLVSGRALLARCGFAEVGRVPDYYRDGIALIILARRTGDTATARAARG